MARTKEISLELFTEAETEGIQPTGSPWIDNPLDPATVPVPLQTVIVKVDGPYKEQDRKLWTFLLHAVFDELGEKQMHTLSIRDINRAFREQGGIHDSKWIWESAKRLARTVIEWDATLGDERVLGVAAIFGANITPGAKNSGRLDFFFPPNLIPIIKAPMRFARVRVHFLMRLSGKYAVTLYEILEGFANRRDGQCRVTLKELRTWLKVPEDKYANWKDFKRWVLEPAIQQINNDADGAGFTVTYEAVRKGRSYNEIVFSMTKTDQRKQADALIKRSKNTSVEIEKAKAENRPVLLEEVINDARRQTDNMLDMEVVQREFWAYWESKGCEPFKKGAGAAFIGFARRKQKQMRGY